MNILLVGKGSKDYPSPVGNIIGNIVDSNVFRDDYFFILSAKSKYTVNGKGRNYEHLEYEDFVIKRKESSRSISLFERFAFFIKKVCSFIYSHLIIDYDYFSFLYAKRKAYRLCKNVKVDCVVGLAGVFSSFDLAYYLAKKLNVPLVLYYFDIFSPNEAMIGHWLASHKERKWQAYSQAILMPRSYKILYEQKGFATNKYVECLFPSFLDKEWTSSSKAQSKDLVYAGGFYDKIREPNEFLHLAGRLAKIGYRFVCYGQSKKAIIRKFGPSPLYDNVVWKDTIAQDKLMLILRDAAALVNVENKFGVRFPSKMLQYLGFGKLILNLNAGRKQIGEYLNEEYAQILSSNDYYATIDDQNGVTEYVEQVVEKIDMAFSPVLLNDSINMRFRQVLLDVITM